MNDLFAYLLVLLCSFVSDASPFPLPPGITVAVLLQVKYDLNAWAVIALGVAGSILGRYVLISYIPRLSSRFFKRDKNEDIIYLGNKLREEGWKGKLIIFVYFMLPLPTTPIFIAAGMSHLKAS